MKPRPAINYFMKYSMAYLPLISCGLFMALYIQIWNLNGQSLLYGANFKTNHLTVILNGLFNVLANATIISLPVVISYYIHQIFNQRKNISGFLIAYMTGSIIFIWLLYFSEAGKWYFD